MRTKLYRDFLFSKFYRKNNVVKVGSINSIFISCIRQQNPLTVLSKIILRKVKQFNLPQKKNEDFCIFEDTPRLSFIGQSPIHVYCTQSGCSGRCCRSNLSSPHSPSPRTIPIVLTIRPCILCSSKPNTCSTRTGLGLAPVLSLLFFCQRMIPTAFLADYRIHAMLLHG